MDGAPSAEVPARTQRAIAAEPASRTSSFQRQLGIDVMVALAIAAAATLVGTRLNLVGGVSIVWVFGGVLVGLFVRIPPLRWIPAVVIGFFGWVLYLNSLGWSGSASVVRAGGEIIAVMAAALAIRWRGCLPVRRINDVVELAVVAVVVSVLRLIPLGVASQLDPGFGAAWSDIAGTVLLNGILGVLVVVPFMNAMLRPSKYRRPTRRQLQWGLLLAAAPALFLVLLFVAPDAGWWMGAEFTVFAFMIAAVLTLPRRALSAWLFAVTILGGWAVVVGRGPFSAALNGTAQTLDNTFRAQALLIVLAITAWSLYALRDAWGRTTAQLDEATSRLHVAVERAAVPMAFGPIVGGPLEANQAMAAFFQVPIERMPSLDWMALTHPDDVSEDLRLTGQMLDGRIDSYRHLKRYVLADGTLKWADVNVVLIGKNDNGEPWGVVQIIDLTAEMQARQELERATERFRTVVHKASIPMSFGPLLHGMAEVNDAFCAFLERSRDDIVQADWRELIHPDDLGSVLPLHEGVIDEQIDRYRVKPRFLMPDGRSKWGDVTVARLDLGQEGDDFVIVQIVDVTAEVVAREQLQHLIDTEAITGLGSRSWITEQLEKALADGARAKRVAALFVDLSEYAIVNQTLGFEAGDDVFARLSSAVADVLPTNTVVGRFWGDRLLIVAPSVSDIESMEALAQRVLEVAGAERVVRGSRVSRTGSIGVALSGPASTVTSMLRTADQALAEAVQAGRSRWQLRHDEVDVDRWAERLEREHELREALDKRQFVVHYQPQVRLSDRRIVGYEALVRWQHPERGVLLPGAFMEVMETSGLVVALGRQVFSKVCADIAATPGLFGPVSVNCSALDILEPDWIDFVSDTVHAAGIAPSSVTIELTETTVLRLTADAQNALATIRGMGMGLHIDDFGVGYASIGSLLQVPLTGLKLDRMFVSEIEDASHTDISVVAGIASMARGLRLETMAEGIETVEQAQRLQEAGWTYGQGFLFGRPVPLNELPAECWV